MFLSSSDESLVSYQRVDHANHTPRRSPCHLQRNCLWWKWMEKNKGGWEGRSGIVIAASLMSLWGVTAGSELLVGSPRESMTDKDEF